MPLPKRKQIEIAAVEEIGTEALQNELKAVEEIPCGQQFVIPSQDHGQETQDGMKDLITMKKGYFTSKEQNYLQF